MILQSHLLKEKIKGTRIKTLKNKSRDSEQTKKIEKRHKQQRRRNV